MRQEVAKMAKTAEVAKVAKVAETALRNAGTATKRRSAKPRPFQTGDGGQPVVRKRSNDRPRRLAKPFARASRVGASY